MVVTLRGIVKSFGDVEVLKNLDMDVHEGERIGLVGRNGAGKSTLANLIFGSIFPDSGTITFGKEALRMGYLLQSTSYSMRLLQQEADATTAQQSKGEFAAITGKLGIIGAPDWEEERFGVLSGGERTKLALAQIWASKPELLILDEPTNHMDFTGVEWLVGEIGRYRGTVLLISHDRYFLDRVAGRIIEIEDGTAQSFSGNYSFYREEKRKQYVSRMHRYRMEKKQQEKIEEEMEKLRQWSDKAHRQSTEKRKNAESTMGFKEFYRAKAKKMDQQIKSKMKRLEKLKSQGIERPKEEQQLCFAFDRALKHGKRILEARKISKGFGGRALFSDSTFFILRGEKVGIVGGNGCGKTTFLRMLCGEETPDVGELWVSPSTKPVYIRQDVADLDEEKTLLQMLQGMEKEVYTRARTLLAGMGFDGRMLEQPVKRMSLGERMRIKLAFAILQETDFLILDEPTNHLDLQSRERLEETLGSFDGTMLLVSHDRYMLEQLCDKLLVFEGGTIRRLEHGLGSLKSKEEASDSTPVTRPMQNDSQKLLLENRIASLVGQLSTLPPTDPAYAQLDGEYKQLVAALKALR